MIVAHGNKGKLRLLIGFLGCLIIPNVPALMVDLAGITCLWWRSLAWMPLLILCAVPFVQFMIASFRTIVMNKDGCTVCFLGYKRCFRWEELTVKQYVYDADGEAKGAEFALKRDKSFPKACFCKHPVSFIYVSFPKTSNGTRNRDRNTTKLSYAVDEELFRSKMKEWHVETQDVTQGIYIR